MLLLLLLSRFSRVRLCATPREIQTSSCVDREKTNLPFELRGRAGGCARVTAGQRRPHLGALIHGPDIPGSYAILLFTALNLASITSPIHNWVPETELAGELGPP